MLYLDASAAVKLVLPETESEALAAFVAQGDALVSSIIVGIEIPRAVERVTSDRNALARLDQVLERIDVRPIDAEIVTQSRRIPPQVRSLDAVHLATALTIGDDLDAMVVYDPKLSDAARHFGIEVLAPSETG